MITLRETDRALMLEHDGIQFWVQKRWLRPDRTLTPAGKKAMAIAADNKRRHVDFDATKTFTVVNETAKAVLLDCEIIVPAEGMVPGNKSNRVHARFWMPRSMLNNYQFVSRKVREIESGFPYTGTKVIWPRKDKV